MVRLQTSLLQRLVQRLQANFTGSEGPGGTTDLPALELMRTLERKGVLLNPDRETGLPQLQASVTSWAPAIRTLVSELLRKLNQKPLVQINESLQRFISACGPEPNAEQLQTEADTVAELIEAEMKRIESIRGGSDGSPGKEREQLREKLDEVERWQANITERGQSLQRQAAEIHAWQIIADIVRDLDQEHRDKNTDAPALELNTRSLRDFTQHVTDVRNIGSDIEPSTEAAGLMNCHAMPDTVARMIQRRTKHIAEHLETFRRLPAKEAEACLERMYEVISHNKLLSAGASGGSLGAIAYAVALHDLERRSLTTAGLIGTADIADFTIRLFAPFMLLLLVFLSIAGSWVEALRADQRRTPHYVSKVSKPLLLCAAFGWLLYAWGNPSKISLGTGVCLAVSGGTLLMLIALGVIGKVDGVKPDDKVQLLIVGTLKACSRPLGTLLLLAMIGVLLVADENVSVLFPDTDRFNGDDAAKFYVLESKDSHEPIRIGPQYARLSTVWMVSRPEVGWFAITGTSVACVRAPTFEEQKMNAPLLNRCTNAKPPPPIQPPTIATPASEPPIQPNTIAAFSIRRWQCLPESFRQGSVVTMTFAHDSYAYSRPTQVAADATERPGLAGFLEPGTPVSDDIAASFPTIGPSDLLLVFGFANSVGLPSHNFDLSERRANTLKRQVVSALAGRASPDWIAEQNVRVVPLGENVLSGLFGEQNNDLERRAVALVCKRGAPHGEAAQVS